jgi:hypothetical protein
MSRRHEGTIFSGQICFKTNQKVVFKKLFSKKFYFLPENFGLRDTQHNDILLNDTHHKNHDTNVIK